MTFVFKTVKKEDAEYQKYIDFEQRYINETPKEVMERHNYLYNHNVDRYIANFYEKNSSNSNIVYVVADNEKAVCLVLIHFDNVSFDYDTPMAWLLFIDNQMILMNCESIDDMGVFDNGERWLKESYLVEPLVLPESLQNREEEIKQYIVDAFSIFSERGAAKLTFAIINSEVVFDQPYEFKGYNT